MTNSVSRRGFLGKSAALAGAAAVGRAGGSPNKRVGPSFEKKWVDSARHYQNFIDCVKSRKSEKLVADIEEGHYSSLLCHLGNIAYRTGRRPVFDPEKATFPNDEEARIYLGREYRKGFELPRV